MRNLLILAFVMIIAANAYGQGYQESRDYLSKIALSNHSKLNGKNGSIIALEAFDGICLRGEAGIPAKLQHKQQPLHRV